MPKFLFMSQNQSLRMLSYSYLYLGFQGQPLPYAHISISRMPLSVCPCQGLYICFHMYMAIARIPVSKCIYVVLKNAPLCMQVSRSLELLLNIYLYYAFQRSIWLHMSLSICPRCISMYVNIRFSIHTPFYKLILGC